MNDGSDLEEDDDDDEMDESDYRRQLELQAQEKPMITKAEYVLFLILFLLLLSSLCFFIPFSSLVLQNKQQRGCRVVWATPSLHVRA